MSGKKALLAGFQMHLSKAVKLGELIRRHREFVASAGRAGIIGLAGLRFLVAAATAGALREVS
jgi:hypothetical protein